MLSVPTGGSWVIFLIHLWVCQVLAVNVAAALHRTPGWGKAAVYSQDWALHLAQLPVPQVARAVWAR